MAKRPGRRYRLVWPEDHDFMAGVVVRLKGISIKQLLDAQRLAAEVADQRESGTGVEPGTLEKLFELLSSNIVEWNITEEDTEGPDGPTPGAPVPTTLEGVMSLELDPVVEILTEWLEAVAGVSPPLSENSPAGEPSEDLSLTMEALLASPTI